MTFINGDFRGGEKTVTSPESGSRTSPLGQHKVVTECIYLNEPRLQYQTWPITKRGIVSGGGRENLITVTSFLFFFFSCIC